MNEASNSTQVQSLFTRGRHLGLSVIYLAQNLFHKGKYSRDLSLNMDYIVLFKKCEIRVKLAILQIFSRNSKFLVWAFQDATQKPYGHLFLDFKPNGLESLMVRGNILGEYQTPKNL